MPRKSATDLQLRTSVLLKSVALNGIETASSNNYIDPPSPSNPSHFQMPKLFFLSISINKCTVLNREYLPIYVYEIINFILFIFYLFFYNPIF